MFLHLQYVSSSSQWFEPIATTRSFNFVRLPCSANIRVISESLVLLNKLRPRVLEGLRRSRRADFEHLFRAYHHSIGAMLALSMCHSSKAALSQSCHFAVFVNPVARSSTDEFFTVCDAHLEHERMAQATSLQRRHEKLTQKQVSAL